MPDIPRANIRNFSIIAHIDHGKSTLADRLLALGKLTDERTGKEQILDSMDIERERGITIKSNSASFYWQGADGQTYLFNLIDTPGHVDFTYEVSRSLAACEGVLLLIDATQGVQAQTLANFYLALEADLYILPVINKIDLPSADVEKTRMQIAQSLGLNGADAVPVSAKSGINIEVLMQAIIDKIPAPRTQEVSGQPQPRMAPAADGTQEVSGQGQPRMAPAADGTQEVSGKQSVASGEDIPARALVFDAYFDTYRGVVEKIRVFDGEIKKGDQICFMRKGGVHQVHEIGISQLRLVPQDSLKAGEVGYIVTGIKNVSEVMLGDTITLAAKPASVPLFKYKEVKPMVFSGLFPVNGDDYPLLKESMEKLALNDPALIYEPESSEALGFGFRVGYLGLLHMEIVQERLEREFGLALLTTAPSVTYHIYFQHKPMLKLNNPAEFPDPGEIDHIEEPYVKVSIISPSEYMGAILQLLADKRGENVSLNYLDPTTVQIIYLVPLAEMIFEFYDRLKSVSRGYASLDYEFAEYRRSSLVKMDILVHGSRVDALSMIVHKSAAETRGRQVIGQLKEHIARHQFQIAIQAAIGGKIIARETISALRKNVTAKCYGGDITRKRKLLEKQKEGKKRMKMIGSVEIPQEAFLSVLKTGE